MTESLVRFPMKDMRRNDLEARVRRLCSGDRRIEDLNRIFAWIRFRSGGRPTLSEVGHFAAHPDIRDKGATFARAVDLFQSSRLWIRNLNFSSLGRQDIYSDKTHRAGMEARLRLYGPERVRKELGVGLKRARRSLKSGLDKIAMSPITENINMNEEEWRILNFLASRFQYEYLFSDDTLVNDLTMALRAEKMMSEFDSLDAHRDFIGLYTASIMHLAEIRLEDGINGHLQAGYDNDGLLCVSLAAPMTSVPFVENKLQVSCMIFKTSVKTSNYCNVEDLPDQGVFSPEEPYYSMRSASWTSPIEVDNFGRISVIR